MDATSEKKDFVWNQMGILEQIGLGERHRVSKSRDKFILNFEHPSADRLTSRPRANGFIRADSNSLLFHHAAEELRRQVDLSAGTIISSDKGLELRWSSLTQDQISRLFEAIRRIATELTPIQQAREYLLDRVQRPALQSQIPDKTKNKIRNANLWLLKFDRIGDLLVYLQRFRPDNEDATYNEMTAHGLTTFETIVADFEKRFSPWAHDRTRVSDFIIGAQYSAYQILIFANIYDTRAGGMFVIKAEDKPAYVVIKATLEGGTYANEWMKKGYRLKYFLKSISGAFSEDYEANATILNHPEVPIVTFVRDTVNNPFTYFGMFSYKDIVRDGNVKYFVLDKEPSKNNENLVTAEHQQKSFQIDLTHSMESGRDQRLARLATASKKPRRLRVITTSFERNPDVVAEVLHRAAGKCEMCTAPAPFNRRSDSTPYLEVHHRIQLAAGGDDTVDNAVAVCPNCHRKSHFGIANDATTKHN